MAYEHVGDGIGFVFPAERTMFGIDLDGCRDPETKRVADWAREIILYLNSYSEVSPSLTGVKVYCLGKLPFDSGKKVAVATEKITDKEPGIEAYDHGRYFAVTGMTLQGMPVELQDRTEQVEYIANTYFKPKEASACSRGMSRSSRLSTIERARKYLERMPASVSGSGGHNAAFHAACVLVLGFGLNKSEALVLMSEFNHRCQPPWSERELEHKINSADKQAGERGFLRDATQERLDAYTLPEWREPQREQATFDVSSMEDAASEFLAELQAGKQDCTSTGMQALDHALGGGIPFGEFVVIGARPSHGKTAFGMQLLDAYTERGYKAAFISEEMSKVALGRRVIQFACGTEEQHWKYQIDAVRKELQEHFQKREKCFLVESVSTAAAAADCVRYLAREHGVRCVAIDYAQLLKARGHSDNERVSEVSKILKAVVNETKVTMFLLAQLNREIEKRDKFAPKITDLGQSDQLARDADVVLFLVWPYRIDTERPAKVFQIWAAKNRNRGVRENMVECEFTPSRLRIAEAVKTVQEFANYSDFGEYGT